VTLRPVALLTDFGLRDPFVGICHGVILREDPAIPIIDLTHGIERQDVRAGAVALADSVGFLPADVVVVGVVDPGVGTDRRAIAVEAADGRIFVGPDNGLLAEAITECGGATAAFEISNSGWRLNPVSETFHGRDVFAPVAAKLAVGEHIAGSGVAIHDELVSLEQPKTTMINGDLTTAVLAIDQYGNARLAATPSDIDTIELGSIVELDTDDMRRQALYARTYAEAENNGDPLLIADSSGALSIAVNGGDAAKLLQLEPGTVVRIQRA
jgi:S-adenosylmethionine hydrolase